MKFQGRPKWSWRYLVVNASGIHPFMFRDTAMKFVQAAGGELWHMESVRDYTTLTVHLKPDAMPLAKVAEPNWPFLGPNDIGSAA